MLMKFAEFPVYETKSKVYLQPLIKPLKYHFSSPWKSSSLPSYIICNIVSTCIVFQAQHGNSHSENFIQAKTSLQCIREILLSQSVTLSTNINVNSNNSLQAEAFTLIIFEYVMVCFIRLYLLVPQNEFFGVLFPRWLYIMLHSCCRELTVENTLESLKGNILLYFIFSPKVKMFHFPSDWTGSSLRSSRLQSAIKLQQHVNQSLTRADMKCA